MGLEAERACLLLPLGAKGGKPVREYVGTGPRAAAAEAADEARRQARAAEARLLRREQSEAADLDGVLDELAALTGLVTDAALVAAGYHEHRGQWRKRRKGMGDTRTIEKPAGRPDARGGRTGPAPGPDSGRSGGGGSPVVFRPEPDPRESEPRRSPTRPEAIRILSDRAAAGNEACLSGLRQVLDDSPEVWGHLGDLAKLAEQALVGRAYPGDPLAAESAKRFIADLRRRVAGEQPGPLEEVLAAQVAVTYVAYHHAEAAAADQSARPGPAAAFLEKRAESAHRRHVNALKALAKVRSLLGTPGGPGAGRP